MGFPVLLLLRPLLALLSPRALDVHVDFMRTNPERPLDDKGGSGIFDDFDVRPAEKRFRIAQEPAPVFPTEQQFSRLRSAQMAFGP
jgi:hypothetical protein